MHNKITFSINAISEHYETNNNTNHNPGFEPNKYLTTNNPTSTLQYESPYKDDTIYYK